MHCVVNVTKRLSQCCCVAETSVKTNAPYTNIVLRNLLKASHNGSVWGVCINASFSYTANKKETHCSTPYLLGITYPG